MSLRLRWMLLMTVAVLAPSVVLGAFARYAANASVTAARASMTQALVSDYGARARVALDAVARRDDALLGQAQSLAVATAAFLGHRPYYWPIARVEGASGWQTPDDSPVGVYAPPGYVPDALSQRELSSAGYIDAFLQAEGLRPGGALHLTFVTLSGLAWVTPNPAASFRGTLPDLRLEPNLFSLALPGSDPTLGPVWTGPFREPFNGRRVVAVLVPVVDANGTFLGVVGVEVELDHLVSPLKVATAPGATLLTTPAGGTVLAAAGRPKPPARVATGLGRARSEASRIARVGGQPVFLDAEALTGPRLALVSIVPEAVVGAELAKGAAAIEAATLHRQGQVALVWVGLTLLLLLGGLVFVERVSHRIRRLSEGVRDFARDLSRRLPEGDDELGRLGREFNAMAVELEGLKLHLEEQVEERTRQLNLQAQALERLNALGRHLMGLRSRQAILDAAVAFLGELGYEGAAVTTSPGSGARAVITTSPRLYVRAADDRLGILPAVAAEVGAALENLRLFALEGERREEARRQAVIEERNRLAREIHDTLAQSFLGIVLHARAIEAEDSASRRHLVRVMELAHKGLEEARRSVLELRPQLLADKGLKEVVEETVARWVDLWGIPATTELEEVEASPETVFTLLRILQEALENVRKHAQAGRVTVRVRAEGEEVRLEVEDDGRGLEGARGGHGLRFMAERAAALGGDLEIRSEGGTLVCARVPKVS
jgi:signal transduction histidine kinase